MSDEKENKTDDVLSDLEGVFIPADEFNGIPNNESGPGPAPGQAFDPELADVIGGMTVMIFGVAEKARGEHWHIEPEQGLDYGKTCATWYQKEFGTSELSPAWALVGASLALLLVPIMGEIELAGRDKKPDQDKNEDGEKSEPSITK